MKEELGGIFMKEFVELRVKTMMKNNNNKDWKAKHIRRKLGFEDYKNCLKAAKKINHLEKNKIDVNSLKEDHKEFIKNNKPILKTQQRFRSEK